LAEVTRALNEALDARFVAHRAAQTVQRLLGCAVALVYRARVETGDLEILARAGDPGPGFAGDFSIPRSAALAGLAARTREIVSTADVLADHRVELTPELRLRIEQGHHRAVLAVPLVVQEAVLGVLVVGDAKGRVFDAGAIGLARAVADQTAVALQNARLLEAAEQARETAETANRAKDEFLATLSHELRTPLTALLGWARMLRVGALDEPTRARALETVERNARLLVQLIEDLLDVSRIVSGKLHLDVRGVDLAAVIEAAIDIVRPAVEAKGLLLESSIDPDAAAVAGDADRLQQVVWNLLSNAVKFTDSGGRVHVALRRAGPRVEIVVTDTGQGIAPAFLPHVFERFRQAEGTSTRVHGGLGLGLALVRHLVELHGGTVAAASDGPGRGATFTVSLPMPARRVAAGEVAVPEVPGPPVVPFDALPSLAGVRVLVVEDEADARDLLRTVLERRGAAVETAATAGEGYEAFEREPPDVLVSDVGLPGESGYAFIARVRARPPARGGAVPALALTAYARREDRVRALVAGFQAHVAKPVEPAELVQLIAELVARART
jgi:signal transduction histidine kinase/CheY-like chemotaxis protein